MWMCSGKEGMEEQEKGIPTNWQIWTKQAGSPNCVELADS